MDHLDVRTLVIVAQFLAEDALDSAHDVERTDGHYIRLEQRGE